MQPIVHAAPVQRPSGTWANPGGNAGGNHGGWNGGGGTPQHIIQPAPGVTGTGPRPGGNGVGAYPDRAGDSHGWQNPGNDNRGWQNQRGNGSGWQAGGPGHQGRYDPQPHGNYRSWDNGWRNQWRADNRYAWRDWRGEHRDAFHIGNYYAPYRDAYYSRLGIGFVLDPVFFGDRYWIYDPWTYHLPPAWGPYRWVRYYDDVLLVDTYTGQVVDVIYDFFW